MILVTGASGFVGGHVARLLLEQGREVRALVRPGSARAEGLERRLPGIRTCEGDLLDERSLAAALRGVDQLVHCAARMGYWSRQDAVQRHVNVDGTVHLLRQARRRGVGRIVHVSTIAAVGCNRDGRRLDEDTPWVGQQRPRVNYVLTKREAEERVLSAARAGTPVTVVNPALMVGGQASLDPAGTAPVRGVPRRVPRRVPPGGSSVAHVEDVARGILLALEAGQVGERYILGGDDRTWLEIADAIARRRAVSPPRGEAPLAWGRLLERGATLLDHLRLSRPPWAPERWRIWGWYTFADSSKAQRELGYSPPTLASVVERLAWT